MDKKSLAATLIFIASSGLSVAMAAPDSQQSNSLPSFDSLDNNKDGAVIKSEYEAYRLQQSSGQPGQQMMQSAQTGDTGDASGSRVRSDLFLRLDANGDGFLSPEEAGKVEALANADKFSTADAQKDGRLSISEFINGTSLTDAENASHTIQASELPVLPPALTE